MNSGVLFLVVGASGVGKDTLLDGAKEELRGRADFIFPKRDITRPADAGGEDHIAISEDEFHAKLGRNEFFAHWQAHGLQYGIPGSIATDLANGKNVIVNVSRSVIGEIAATCENLRVIEITAPPDILASRLSLRGREDAEEVSRRLARKASPYPPDVEVLSVVNDGTAEEGICRLLSTLYSCLPRVLTVKRMPVDTWHESICFLHRDCEAYSADDYLGPGKVDVFSAAASIRAKVNIVDDEGLVGRGEIGLSAHAFEKLGLPEGTKIELERTPSPESVEALRGKIQGKEISHKQIDLIIRDIVEDRYSGREISAFLVAAARDLSLSEVSGLAKARAAHAHRFEWSSDIIVDKHSMGGIPGSRITLIVTPIVAAHGLMMPKTSSRAITSAAGTADAMETVASVDLTPDEVQRIVGDVGGCIAWNGRLNHSPVDDVMNSITRPLGIDSTKWSVASILSKKLSAGSTHVAIDIPVGRQAKITSQAEGDELAALFESVGDGVGLTVSAHVTDGGAPIGRGIGPALEVRDVYRVLRNEDHALQDLAAKSLKFAGHILEWDPAVEKGDGAALAKDILSSGRALETFERIIDLQGRRPDPFGPGTLIHEIKARNSGVVREIDTYQISGVARRAGAPHDKGAGIDLMKTVGDTVNTGDVLYLIHANIETDFRIAIDSAEHDTGFIIA